ncbi:hypothetical protein [Lacrimispora sp.]|uniref:hypothetical protein n=1 Tax=Lacrimispora sp. TaxID=2719234 RepID=UPI0028AE7118|nr:hypothetical protein [Lacrimispora sp.]
MENSDILYFYGTVIFDCITILFFFYFAISKKMVSDSFKDNLKDWVKRGKNQIYFEVIFRICMLSVAIWGVKAFLPDFKDIPFARNEDFNTVTGVVKAGDTSRNNTVRKRYIRIVEDGTNKEIHIRIRGGYVESGEVMTVVYLPNSGFGSRIYTKEKVNEPEQDNIEKRNHKWIGQLSGELARIIFFSVVLTVWIKSLKGRKNVRENEGNVVRTPMVYRQIGIFCVVVSIILIIFFTIGHAEMHIKIIGIPLFLLGVFWIYLTYHWKILVNTDSIVVIHNFKFKQIVPYTSIEKLVLKNIYTIAAELGENMDIYVNGKKITNLDECYEGYQYLKEMLIKNNVRIEKK